MYMTWKPRLFSMDFSTIYNVLFTPITSYNPRGLPIPMQIPNQKSKGL